MFSDKADVYDDTWLLISGCFFFSERFCVKFDWRRPKKKITRLSPSFCALLITLLFVINKYIPSDSFLMGS